MCHFLWIMFCSVNCMPWLFCHCFIFLFHNFSTVYYSFIFAWISVCACAYVCACMGTRMCFYVSSKIYKVLWYIINLKRLWVLEREEGTHKYSIFWLPLPPLLCVPFPPHYRETKNIISDLFWMSCRIIIWINRKVKEVFLDSVNNGHFIDAV